jgi:mono/diheme cytochrome c family protein
MRPVERQIVWILAAVVVLAPALALVRVRSRARAAAPLAERPPAVAYETHIQPLLARYCVNCHGPAKKKAELDLTKYRDEAAIAGARKTWKKVWDQLQAREMPPQDKKPQPTVEEREFLANWIESALERADAAAPPDPGRVVIRRLNRVEYRNTVRDLIGVDFNPVEDFPHDDVGYGFDNIGDVLTLPPILMEKYFAAAEKILDKAIVSADKLKPRSRRLNADALQSTQVGQSEAGMRILFANGEVFSTIDLQQTGQYVIRVRACGDQAGSEPAKMTLKIDARELKPIDVPAPRTKPAIYEEKIAITSGKHRLAAAFINDYYNPEARKPAERDRNLLIDFIEVVGPVDVKPPEPPEGHKHIFIAQPGPVKSGREAAGEILSNFARRAFRRPLKEGELDRLLRLYELAEKQGDPFESAMKVPLQAVLVSPHFLFRVEPDRADGDPKGVHRVGDFELASRLSYFLWSSMPDDELFELAGKGTLHEPAALEAQVGRMLRDPKASSLATNFAIQWLQLRRLDLATPDARRYPAWSDTLRESMRQETALFFEAILREDRSVVDLLDADFTFVNEPLAKHYGLEGVKGPEMRRVRLPDARRGGVLTMGGVLTVTSNPTRTSPVKRGKWVLETILGTPPPPPLPDAGELKDEPEGAEKLTVRQRLELHRADPSCAACHRRMDPIGLGFENYDAIGGWREKEGKLALDPSGTLIDGRSFVGPVELKKILLSRKDDYVRCLTEKMLTYALGRGVEYYDTSVVRGIRKTLAGKEYRFSALVMEIVRSAPFQFRRNRASEVKDG